LTLKGFPKPTMTEHTCPNCDDYKETDEEICEGCQKCKTCFGTGIQEYQIAVDDFREMGCEDCGYDPDDDGDRLYDAWKDDQMETKDD
tara:strand:- start:292 stop:555 length:264 start_codon:yes stop_codon:yes gene_type:complete